MNYFESKVVTHSFNRHARWEGRSGRAYAVVSENLEHFALGGGDLFMITRGSHVLWVGSSEELVEDHMSRSRFRLALDCADRVFRVLTPGKAAERLSTIWDLEGAAPMVSAKAAA